MLLETVKGQYARALAANSVDTSFPSRIPTITQPTNAIGDVSGMLQQNGVLLLPFAVAADTDTFSMRLIGWRSIGPAQIGTNAATRLWIPTVLGEFACTCSTPVGVANAPVVATERFCDTITLVGTTGNANISHEIVSPANDTIAYILADLKGCQLFEVTFDSTSAGTAAGMNSLYSLI